MGSVFCHINLLLAGRPQWPIAKGAAVHAKLRADESLRHELRHLVPYTLGPDPDGILSPPSCELAIPGEKDAPLSSGPLQKGSVLPSVPRRHLVCTQGIVSHEPQVPGKGSEHAVDKKSRFLRKGGHEW
jgi:hypothetical protein